MHKKEQRVVLLMDYKKLGLKVGLEIHQQINSGTKLFCRCPIMRSEEFPIEIRRKLRAVPGELGDFDPAALQEYLKNRTFVYKMNPESSCLVEIDEDPPKQLNYNALKTVIQICKLMHCHVVDEVHVMRKTVVDGSAVSGFQRTALIGKDGYVEGSFGRVGIQTIMLEEDAATPLAKDEGFVEYRLDRLGIPLIEIATESSISSPQMAKDVAEHIGLLLRSTDVVRGIGSIRQDINVSIAGGERIEIKGFQELAKIPDAIINEVNRQLALLEIKEELKKRGFKGTKENGKDVTNIFMCTKSNFIRKIIDSNGHVFALLVPKFSGLLKKQCGDRTFGKELSAYAEAYGLGIIHSDEELGRYGLGFEFDMLKKEMRAGPEDLVLITVGYNRVNISNALSLIVSRLNQCANGVPRETRTADGEGSRYARPLPGSGRLYPESDVPSVRLDRKLISSIETPRTLMEKKEEEIKRLKQQGMKESVARAIVTYKTVGSEYTKKITDYSGLYKNVDVNFIAKLLVEIPKEIKSRFRLEPDISDQVYSNLLDSLNKGEIPQDAVLYILVDYLTNQDLSAAIGKYKLVTDKELRKIVRDVVAENKGKKESVLMGIIMQKVRGRVEGDKVAKILREML